MERKNFSTWFAFVLLLGITGTLFGQQASKADPNVVVYPKIEVPLGATVQFSECKDDWDFFLKTTKRHSIPGQEMSENEMARWKQEAAEAAPLDFSMKSAKTTAGPAPTLGASFLGNTYNNFDPADNGIAVSTDGIVVCVSNSRIHVFDTNGAASFSTSLLGFSGSLSGVPGFRFDPRVTFDPVAERFIVVYLAGSSPGNSNIVVAFSQSSDPSQGWNFYKLTGDPFNESVWTDFPSIGISNDELFITVNLFSASFQYQNSGLWVIDKATGYAGNALGATPIQNPYYSMHPVEGGLNMYGPNFYFLRTPNSPSGTEVFLHEITNTQANGGVLNAPQGFVINTPFGLPPTAPQLGTSVELATNFTNVMSAYYENNRLQFALNTSLGGQSAILYGTGVIQPPFSSFFGQYITYPDMYLAYPAVGYAGTFANGVNHTFLSFLYSGPNRYPGYGCVFIDDSGVSDSLICRSGDDFMLPNTDRWGDYADMAERPGHPGEVWVVGTYGNSQNIQRTHISEVKLPGLVSREEPLEPVETTVFPNPAQDRSTYRFPVDETGDYSIVIRSVDGKVVKRMDNYNLPQGEASLAFSTGQLSNGVYMVSIENQNKVLFTERLSIQR